MSKWLQIALMDETGNEPVTKLTELTKTPVSHENSNKSAVFNGAANDGYGDNGLVTKLTKPSDEGDTNNIVNSVTDENSQVEGCKTPESPQKTADTDNIVNSVNFVTSIHSNISYIETGNIEFEEREAIVANNGTPEEWVTGYATLVSLPCPENWTQERWDQVLINTEKFLAEWGAQAHRLGWSANDLFGISQSGSVARLDCLGLVHFLDGNRVTHMTEKTAILQCLNERTGEPNGSSLRYYRKDDMPGSVPIWEVVKDE